MARHAPIAAEDQGRVIANILIAPEVHAGQIHPLFGAKEMTFAEMTEETSPILGISIRYQQVDVRTLSRTRGMKS